MLPCFSQFATGLLAIDPATGVLSAGGALVLLVGLWLPFGPGARRRRAFRRAQFSLQQGSWQEALAQLKQQQQAGRLSLMWEGRLRNLEGECRRFAGQAALSEHRYDEALEHLLASARLLDISEQDERGRVLNAMLDHVRRLVATGSAADLDSALALAGRVLDLEPRRAEALFWQGLCHVRRGDGQAALAALRAAQESEATGFLDPSLYLGALLLREGAAQEAVRYLSEANRLAPTCPLATWQLGLALLKAGGDSQVAARALLRARERLASLRKTQDTPQRLWLDTLPEGKSYVRSLALKYAYTCPLLGGSLASIYREIQLGLGEALYRQGNFQEAVQQYTAVLHESPPTVPVLRGLGQSLARAERYEEAYNHLRAAFDREETKNPFTAGYLALCGAKGKPSGPDDKIKNVQWALSLLAHFDIRGDREWAELCNTVHAEARALSLPIAADDQVRLCEALTSVTACDSQAAQAYEHLSATYPERVRAEYAWRYCRAVEQHRCGGEHDLDLFARAFAEEPAARAFYAERAWNFDDMEFTYLERAAAKRAGRFPNALGEEYAAKGESFLLARSLRHEQAGDAAAALTSVAILLALAPHSTRALDRLAQLHFRRGDLERATELLQTWHALEPANPLPLVRQAVVEQKRGDRERLIQAIDLALQRTHQRAQVAFLGARLVLADLLNASEDPRDNMQRSPGCEKAICWLTECLEREPGHTEALWCLAGVYALIGDGDKLAGLSTRMDRPDVSDARFRFLAACSHLAAGRPEQALKACAGLQTTDAALRADTAYVAALAHLQAGDAPAAAGELAQAVATRSPSFDHAHALLGKLSFAEGNHEQAIRHWESVDPARRAGWRLDEPLRQTTFLSALSALQSGDFAYAANRLRDAGRLGVRDRRLAGLLILALVRDGQRLLREASTPLNGQGEEHFRQKLEAAARLFEQALNTGSRQPEVPYLLALACKRQNQVREARAAFRKIAQPDANVLLQLGLLSLREGQLAQAEQELTSAWQMDSQSYALGFDLLMTRLSLGQAEASLNLLPQLAERAPAPDQRNLLAMLQTLFQFARLHDGQAGEHLRDMDGIQEQRLLELLRSAGRLEATSPLLESLARVRPTSAAARSAWIEAVLLRATSVLERCDWTGAERLLLALEQKQCKPEQRQALLNLLGCCAGLGQELKKAADLFRAALQFNKDDACLLQNLALLHEWLGQHAEAERLWDGYFDNLSSMARLAAQQEYGNRLAFEGYARLATLYTDKERWSAALKFAQRAYKLRRNDPDLLEKLFHLYTQSGRTDEARRMLRELRDSRPGDAQFELYELDLKKVRSLDGVEDMIANIERVLKRNPNDARVEVRANLMVANTLPIFDRLFNQLADQLTKVSNQIRYLPKYQIDWPAVREVASDLRHDFNRLRRLSNRCIGLINDEEQRDTIRALGARIERKLEQCRSLTGGSHGR